MPQLISKETFMHYMICVVAINLSPMIVIINLLPKQFYIIYNVYINVLPVFQIDSFSLCYSDISSRPKVDDTGFHCL